MADFWYQIPTEIRLMIWDYVGVAEQRVVFVNHSNQPFKRNVHRRRKFVRESPPILLRICRESRQLALSRYTLFFRLAPQHWSCTGSRTSLDLQSICQYVGVPRYSGSKETMEQKLKAYVDERVAEGGTMFSQLLKSYHGWGLVPIPQWFDPRADVLLLKLAYGLQLQKSLFSPRQSSEFAKLRKVAFVIDRFQSTQFTPPARVRSMIFGNYPPLHYGEPNLDIRLWQLPELQQINLLVLLNREIVRIEADDKGLLKAGQWAYSLAPRSDDFKKELGSSWSGVLWKVTLAKEDGQCLMQAAIRWAPKFRVWEQHKMNICLRRESSINITWLDSSERNPFPFDPTAPEQQLVEGADENTYLGISFV